MLLWTVVLAAAPVSEALRVGVARALQHDGRRAGGGRRRLRAALTVAQIALSVVLVVGALLLVRTVQRIQQVDRRASTPTACCRSASRCPGRAIPIRTPSTRSRASCRTALAALPGATAASAVSHAPYDHVPNWGGPFLATEGADASTAPQADYRAVAPGLMELLGVTLVEGRTLHRERRPPRAPRSRSSTSGWRGARGRASRRSAGGSPSIRRWPARRPPGPPSSAWCGTCVTAVRSRRCATRSTSRRGRWCAIPSVYLIKTSVDPATLGRAACTTPCGRSIPALPIYDVRPLDGLRRRGAGPAALHRGARRAVRAWRR